jgi:putative hydroxymethylpyrimidine transport system substrate-binding protein
MSPMSTAHRLHRRALIQGIGGGALALPLLATGAGAPGSVSRHTAAQELTSVSLALDWYPNANHAGLYVAQDRGYFTEAGLEVEIFTPADPTTVLQTVGAGRDTFGITYQNDVLQARSQDVPVVSVAALVQHPLNCLMVLEESPVQTPADLAGKTVAIAGLPSDEAFLDTMLRNDGASIDDVEVVNVGYDLMPAVLSERADAVIGVYWTHETILAEQQGSPVRYLRVEEWGVPDYYELVLVTGEAVLSDQEDTVRALLGAMQRGYTDAMADLDGALDLLLAASPDLEREVEREGLDLLAPVWTDNGTVAFGTQTSERWSSYATWAKEHGLLAEDVDEQAAFRGDLLPAGSATPDASPVP